MIATAMARLLQGAERALFRTELAVLRSVQSIMMASNRWRVSLWIAPSGSEQCSIPMSRSLKTRRRTRTIFSSEHSTSDFRLIGSLQNPGGWGMPEVLPLMGAFFFLFLRIQEVGHVAQLFGCRLQSLDLLASLGLFGLLLAKHLVDISHETAS